MGAGNKANGSGPMPAGKSEQRPLTVGDAVTTDVEPVSGDGEPTRESGVIVEDFAGSLAKDDADYGRDWALARRWAIRLDDGRLVFRGSDEISRADD